MKMLAVLATGIISLSYSSGAFAQEGSGASITAPTPQPAAPTTPQPAPPSAEPKFDKFLKGFYGTFDVSFDVTTKGMDGLVAYPYSFAPGGGFTPGPAKAGPVGRVGLMPELSTNKSGFGYKGDHTIGDSGTQFLYQIEAGFAITSAPGISTSWTQTSNVVKSAWGYGDSFVGFASKGWGALKVGTTFTPYKKATDRLNPFSGQLGDYAAVMGNTGGDNRVEFGTRVDHSIWYESPKIGGVFAFDLLWSPGQNRTYDNVIQSAGSPDCNGGNQPGSGNLPLNCDDGGFSDALSADVRFEFAGFYLVGAMEWHDRVNRNSDGIGSNNPYYGSYAAAYPGNVISATNNPQGLPASALGAYTDDIAPEWAGKVGLQYAFPFGLTVSGIFEILRRPLPDRLAFQNERQRNGTWLAASQKIGANGVLSGGWAHATKTPGDPGGQHNYNPTAGDDTANMFTVAYKHQLDKAIFWYFDFADTINNGNAHFDIGAGGRGITTDCHDGTNIVFVDYSGTGPTTWGGCNEYGLSTGVNYKF